MQHKPFSVISSLRAWTLVYDPKINRANPQLKGSLYVKFHDVNCKGKVIMHKNIFMNQCSATLTFDLLTHEIIRAHLRLMGSLYVKFHDNKCKGKYNNAKRSIPAHPTPIVTFTFELWPPKSIGLTMVNMSAKLNEEAQNGLVCVWFTAYLVFPYVSTVTLTFDL